MACGVPCIGTRIGGIPEVIEDGVTGYICELGDVETAASKAVQLLSDQQLHQQISRGALQAVNQKFHSTEIVNQYEQLYYNLLQR